MNLFKKRPLMSVCVCWEEVMRGGGGGAVVDKVVNLFYRPFYI